MSAHKDKQAIELFSGTGGLSLGLHNAGWEVIESIEYDNWAVQTYQENFPETKVHHTDVRSIDFNKFKGIGLIAGGPPCQPFSVAGKQLAKQDQRDMVPEFIRAIDEARPESFILENVQGLTTSRHHHYLEWVVSSLDELGYSMYLKVLDAAAFGVPQHRLRLFIIGVPHGVRFGFPIPTHGENASNEYISAGKAIENAPYDEPNTAIVTYAKNPILRPSPWAGMLVNGKGRPINIEAPSPTIPATAGGNRTPFLDPNKVLVEYHEHLRAGAKPRQGLVPGVRRLTLRECARIQTFPDDFQFLGPKTAGFRQVGNAVPPLLGQVVGKSVYDALHDPDRLDGKISLDGVRTIQKMLIGKGQLVPCVA